MKDINYTRNFSKQIIEIDEPFEMIITIINKKLLPVPFLQITEKIPSYLNYQSIDTSKDNFHNIIQKDFYDFTTTMYILPYQKVERRYVLSGSKRGRYIYRATSLKVGDFIGLKDVFKSIDGFQDLIVLPNKLELDEVLESYGSYYGDIPIRRWIIDDPLMNTGIREYTGNEPEKHIHWPSSLKYGTLMVKNFDFTTFIIITPKIFKSYIKLIEKLKNRDNKVILISLEKDNLSAINPSIIKYVMKRNKQVI